MFRFSKTLDPITLFHSPTLASSARVLNILKQASTVASETATEDQASDYTSHAKKQRGEFQLEVTDAFPTTDQLRNILDYVGNTGVGGKADAVIKGAKNAEDAIKRFKENEGLFVRPVTVDWTNGKAVVGDNESEILKMVRQLEEN
ncbi:hypothetical protein ASPWEDRAFT_24195 [Aspergillus wentii DTO 134E9]|uniref:Thioredoxin-like fold domain-containing protein n=1 Tax=Aspergillus wentii DTO 134E9 TaxID=1073089 RepID=A0A1L9RTI3_ASPWE|nr:uncharacterized protein ASPWEDRAFT_24195 [Aspergillus wentii DTO 134E9]KAI9933887.1 hypothetical protein MW887_004959 [Aspergillus wentii]OJJ38240.1 hypothetical protein ASPWEDRAFT_24195 [Aspergillus wentii DTO 134E9]